MKNYWIQDNGELTPVPNGAHARTRPSPTAIRVSQPERRRTYFGIEVPAGATPEARRTVLRAIRDIRRNWGGQIVADVAGETFNVLATDRPTALNLAINSCGGVTC